MRFQVCHGALPHERHVPQPFEVDIELGVDLSRAEASDRLRDTVNYADAVARVRAVMEGPPSALLERLAGRLADTLFELEGVDSVKVRLRKMAPPVGLTTQYAEVETSRGL